MLAGTVVVPFVADSGRGSSHETYSKPAEAGFTPKMNANVGREDESATKAALRSSACFGGGLKPVATLNENDGREAMLRRRAACFGSLGVDFVECGSELGPASGKELVTAIANVGGVGRLGIAGGFGADSEKGTLG
jgi:hypothetical protein